DLRLGQTRQIDGLAEEGGPRVRPRFSGDDIHHRRFTGAVRADDASKLARVDGERKVVECLEPVEADCDAVEIEDAAVSRIDALAEHSSAGGDRIVPLLSRRGCAHVRSRRRAHSPAIPRGRKSVTKMKRSPSANSQDSGKALVNQLLPRLTAAAPS